MQESSSLFLLKDLLQDTNPRNQQQPLNTTDFRISRNYPHPTVGRPGGRPGAQQRVGSLQSVDRAVDRALSLCTLCTSVDRRGRPIFCLCGQATGPVDRTTCSAVVVLFSAVVSFAFRRRLPWRSPRQPLGYPCQLPWQ